MNFRVSAFALLFSCFLAYSVTVDHIIQSYTEPDENITRQAFSTDEGSFVVVSVNKVETFLVRNEINDPPGASLVRQQADIERILKAEFLSRIGFTQAKSEILNKTMIFNASREIGGTESECRRLTGTDRYPCTDKNTCLFACRSVPACDGAAHTDDFLFAIRDWSQDSYAIDSAVSAILEDVESGALDSGGIAIDIQLDRVSVIKSRIGSIKYNKLLSSCGACYAFCKPIPFNMTALDYVATYLARIKNNLTGASSVAPRASAIAMNGESRIGYISNRSQWIATIATDMAIALSSIGSSKSALASKVDAPEAGSNYSLLQNMSEEVISLKNSQLYRQAFAKAADFNVQAARLNETISELNASYGELMAAKSNAETALKKADSLLSSNETLRDNLTDLQQEFQAVVSSMGPPVKSRDIGPFTESFEGITEKAKAVISEKIISTPEPSQSILPSQCASLLSIVLVLAMAFFPAFSGSFKQL